MVIISLVDRPLQVNMSRQLAVLASCLRCKIVVLALHNNLLRGLSDMKKMPMVLEKVGRSVR